MKGISIILSVLLNLVFAPVLVAQSTEAVEMADAFRAEGKIYVVVLVVAIVFTGLIIYAANTERKLSRIEKEIKGLKSIKDS